MIKYTNGKPPPIIVIRDYLRSLAGGVDDATYPPFPESLKFVNLLNNYNKTFVTFMYCIVNGFVSIAIMAAVAMWSKNPFIFPSLGPTAFLFFFSPKLRDQDHPDSRQSLHRRGLSPTEELRDVRRDVDRRKDGQTRRVQLNTTRPTPPGILGN